jgi:hypothetical protein
MCKRAASCTGSWEKAQRSGYSMSLALRLKCFGKARLCLCFALFLFFGCERASEVPCRWGDQKCGVEKLEGHPLRQVDSWLDMMKKPLHERVGIGDKRLVAFTALDNIAGGFPDRPRITEPNNLLLLEVKQVLAELPPIVTKKLAAKLAGVMFVENFGGTGLTQYVYDKAGAPVAAFIVLNPSALEKRTANSWATWKENSPFKPDNVYKLVATIESAAGDTRKNAIRYLLLHEIGHVLSVNANFHPLWTVANVTEKSLAAYPFARISWLSLENRSNMKSRFDDFMQKRKEVVYYFGARLNGTEAIEIYRKLGATSFPTLYAATNWGDDFAESFANYIHVVLDKRPFEIRFEQNGVSVFNYRSCWEELRCQEKRKLIEAYLTTD